MCLILVVCCFCLGFVGCVFLSIMFMGRSIGDVGVGFVEGVWFGNFGLIEIVFCDEVYCGIWVVVCNLGIM